MAFKKIQTLMKTASRNTLIPGITNLLETPLGEDAYLIISRKENYTWFRVWVGDSKAPDLSEYCQLPQKMKIQDMLIYALVHLRSLWPKLVRNHRIKTKQEKWELPCGARVEIKDGDACLWRRHQEEHCIWKSNEFFLNSLKNKIEDLKANIPVSLEQFGIEDGVCCFYPRDECDFGDPIKITDPDFQDHINYIHQVVIEHLVEEIKELETIYAEVRERFEKWESAEQQAIEKGHEDIQKLLAGLA